jgi:DHA1 family multidrug resistance protein-like MFS transporter
LNPAPLAPSEGAGQAPDAPLFGGPLTAAALVLAMMTEAIGYGMVAPTLPFMARLTGAGEDQIGLLVGIYAAVGLVAAPWLGTLANRRGHRFIVLLGLACLTVASIGFTLAPNYPALVLARLVQGFGAAGVWVGCLTLAAELSADATMGRSLSWLTGAWSLGFIIGPALGGIGTLRLPFLIYSVLAACALGVGMLGLPMTGGHGPGATLPGILRVVRRPNVLASGVATLGLAFFFGAVEAFLPLLVASGGGAQTAAGQGALAAAGGITAAGTQEGLVMQRMGIGLLFSIAGLPSVLLPRLVGRLADRYGDAPVIGAGFLVATAWSAAFLTFFGRSPDVVLFLMLGAVEVLVYVPAVALLHRGVATEDRIFASGSHAYAFSIGFFLGPALTGALFPLGGYRTMFATIGASSLVATGVVWLLARRSARQPLADRGSAY